MRSGSKLVQREGAILIGSMVIGLILLLLSFGEGVGAVPRLFSGRGADLVVAWAVLAAPYVAYLVIRLLVLAVKLLLLGIVTLKYVIDAGHDASALAKEERASGRYAPRDELTAAQGDGAA